jgi:hypothetical protein
MTENQARRANSPLDYIFAGILLVVTTGMFAVIAAFAAGKWGIAAWLITWAGSGISGIVLSIGIMGKAVEIGMLAAWSRRGSR